MLKGPHYRLHANRGDLLNEYITWCNKLNIRCVTMGTHPILEREQADKLILKQWLWKENDGEIRIVWVVTRLCLFNLKDWPCSPASNTHARRMSCCATNGLNSTTSPSLGKHRVIIDLDGVKYSYKKQFWN